jgi:leader peptidase (prepilin peptidase)/N-methyltransferase
MYVLAVVIVILLGLIFGSFLNVCVARLPRHESIVRPRSRCPRCKAPIAARDNIPVLSYLFLRGRCRACRHPISWRYPAVELLLSALWVLCWLEFGFSIRALGMAVLSFLLLGLAMMDAETLRLPDAFTWPGIVLGIVYSGAVCRQWARCAVLSAAWAATFAGLLLAVAGIYWLLRRRAGMGIGDAKLLALIAAWLGPAQGVLVLFLGVIAAAIYGIALSAARRKINATTALPFGSFLCAAAVYAIFDGQRLINWYLGLLR